MKGEKENQILSIIIPHYNSIYGLQKLLKSIPIREEIQILVIDDKSDIEEEMYNRLSMDKQYYYVEFIRNETPKKGAGVCRNIGLERAVGEWVMFADADDFFLGGFYEKIEKYLVSKADIIFFTLTSMNLKDGSLANRHIAYNKIINRFLESPAKANENRLRYCTNVPYSKLIKRKIVEDRGIEFDDTLVANDVMFSTKVGSIAKRIEASKERIYCVTCSGGTLTKIHNKETFYIRYKVFVKQYKFIENRLSIKEFTELNLNGKQVLRYAMQYNIGPIRLFLVVMKMRKDNVKIIGRLRDIL